MDTTTDTMTEIGQWREVCAERAARRAAEMRVQVRRLLDAAEDERQRARNVPRDLLSLAAACIETAGALGALAESAEGVARALDFEADVWRGRRALGEGINAALARAVVESMPAGSGQ